MEIDLSSTSVRAGLVQEILGDENKRRKAESLKRFEIYKERQGRWIIEKLREEFSLDTVRDMRKILSINLVTRIVDECAAIYKESPERSFGEISDNELEQIENIYKCSKVDTKLKQANRYFKLFDQCAIKVLPKNGKLEIKVLSPHQYDVIPMADDPETAFCYIINVFDKFEWLTQDNSSYPLQAPRRNSIRDTREVIDGNNQAIADADDYKEKAKMRFIVWTADQNFTMDGNGTIVSEVLDNPIGRLPFINVVAADNDFEFFARRGNGVVDFALEYGVLLSDVANINRLQGYAQAVITAEEQPRSVTVGPNTVMFLQQDSDPAKKDPKFEFVSPSPDMASSLELLETYLRLFLSSRGIDPKTVSGKSETQRFSSGIERLLSHIEKFDASLDDFDLFKDIEQELFEILTLWSNELQGATDGLMPKLNLATINQDATLEVKFQRPQAFKSETEQEDSAIKLIDAGLKSRREAIKELREIDDEMADKVMEEIDGEGFTTEQFAEEAMENGGETTEAESEPSEDVRAEDS